MACEFGGYLSSWTTGGCTGADERPSLRRSTGSTTRRITLRLETNLGHVVVDGILVRTIALTLSPALHAASKTPAVPVLPAALLTTGLPGCSALCPATGAPRSSANASRSDCDTRPDRHHRNRRHHPARVQPTRSPDQDRPSPQPQRGPPTRPTVKPQTAKLAKQCYPSTRSQSGTHHLAPGTGTRHGTRHGTRLLALAAICRRRGRRMPIARARDSIMSTLC